MNRCAVSFAGLELEEARVCIFRVYDASQVGCDVEQSVEGMRGCCTSAEWIRNDHTLYYQKARGAGPSAHSAAESWSRG